MRGGGNRFLSAQQARGCHRATALSRHMHSRVQVRCKREPDYHRLQWRGGRAGGRAPHPSTHQHDLPTDNELLHHAHTRVHARTSPYHSLNKICPVRRLEKNRQRGREKDDHSWAKCWSSETSSLGSTVKFSERGPCSDLTDDAKVGRTTKPSHPSRL